MHCPLVHVFATKELDFIVSKCSWSHWSRIFQQINLLIHLLAEFEKLEKIVRWINKLDFKGGNALKSNSLCSQYRSFSADWALTKNSTKHHRIELKVFLITCKASTITPFYRKWRPREFKWPPARNSFDPVQVCSISFSQYTFDFSHNFNLLCVLLQAHALQPSTLCPRVLWSANIHSVHQQAQ